MAAVTICSDFGAPQNSLTLFPLFPHLFPMKWWDQMPWSSFFEHWVLSQLFHSPLSPHQEAFQFLFTFWHKGGVICISEVTDISPCNLDSSLRFLKPRISHDVLSHKLKKQGYNIQTWHTPFPIWNQSVFPCPVITVASWPGYRFLKREVRWPGIPISFRIFHSLLWSTQSKALT